MEVGMAGACVDGRYLPVKLEEASRCEQRTDNNIDVNADSGTVDSLFNLPEETANRNGTHQCSTKKDESFQMLLNAPSDRHERENILSKKTDTSTGRHTMSALRLQGELSDSFSEHLASDAQTANGSPEEKGGRQEKHFVPCGEEWTRRASTDLRTAGKSAGLGVRDLSLEREVPEYFLVSKEDEEPSVNDTEGAVGNAASGSEFLSVPPPKVRRASIVTTDTRKEPLPCEAEPMKIAVFGKDGVGKSALIVRLLTGRFIGEYDPSMEAVYNYQIPLPGKSLPLQIMDTAGVVDVAEEGREAQVSWGEGFLLVFSVTSLESFKALHRIRRVISELTPGPPRPTVLVGNKADLSHAREVTPQEILDLAVSWGCDYFEVAAPESWDVVIRPFIALYDAILENRNA